MMTYEEIIDVATEAKNGKMIEARSLDGLDREWLYLPDPLWDFAHKEYRVKIDPIEIEVLIHADGTICRPIQGLDHPSWAKNGWTKKKFREVVE